MTYNQIEEKISLYISNKMPFDINTITEIRIEVFQAESNGEITDEERIRLLKLLYKVADDKEIFYMATFKNKLPKIEEDDDDSYEEEEDDSYEESYDEDF